MAGGDGGGQTQALIGGRQHRFSTCERAQAQMNAGADRGGRRQGGHLEKQSKERLGHELPELRGRVWRLGRRRGRELETSRSKEAQPKGL